MLFSGILFRVCPPAIRAVQHMPLLSLRRKCDDLDRVVPNLDRVGHDASYTYILVLNY